MPTASPDSTRPETLRFSIRLPHWGWFAVATLVLVTAGLGLAFWTSIWIPYQSEQRTIGSIQRLGGSVQMSAGGWDVLRQVIGNEPMAVFDRVSDVELAGAAVADADL